jgi:metal-sulfur cluster biosynthetic enzyme
MINVGEEQILRALRQVIDPEIGVNIVDLGLVYSIDIGEADIAVKMTMTTRTCPLGSYLKQAAEGAIRAEAPAVSQVRVDLVWDPPWSPAMMSAAARQQLG